MTFGWSKPQVSGVSIFGLWDNTKSLLKPLKGPYELDSLFYLQETFSIKQQHGPAWFTFWPTVYFKFDTPDLYHSVISCFDLKSFKYFAPIIGDLCSWRSSLSLEGTWRAPADLWQFVSRDLKGVAYLARLDQPVDLFFSIHPSI